MIKSFFVTIALTSLAFVTGANAQTTTVIDPLNGTHTGSYTTFLVNDVSHGAGNGVTFSESAGSLSALYTGTNTTAEQALYLAPVSAFSTTFAVGDTLLVSTAVPVSSTAEDFGIAVSSGSAQNANASDTPTAWDSRSTFDWTAIYIRPSQTAVRTTSDANGVLVTGSFVQGAAANTVQDLFITWLTTGATNTFALGYVVSGTSVTSGTFSFAGSSNIGADIGFYGDLRATSGSLGSLSNLSIVTPVPEPATFATLGLGVALLVVFGKRSRRFRQSS